MNYPFWDVGIGYGVLMALISIIHVFISHFAIGGGLFLVVNERQARKADDAERLTYLERLSKLFVLITLVLGALTGVGIWFIIGLLNPAATEVLIHHYVWGWAIEWTFFITEITAAILYYYGWQRMNPGAHLVLGWIYFVAAWLSLVIINGIITFMLTPGQWLQTGNFWDGFFNPTYWPSLVFRTGIAVMLAGLFAMLVASRSPAGPFRQRMVRINALWGLVGLALMAPAFYWYWRAIPAAVTAVAQESMRMPMAAVEQSLVYATLLAGALLLFGLLLPRLQRFGLALVVLVVGLAYFGSFEWFRESLRKPYVISDYMYGNATEVARAATYQADGLLAHLAFRTGDDGADLFRHACRTCHTLDGYRPLAPAFAGMDDAFITAIVRGTGALYGNMPPFLGTTEEAGLIAGYLAGHTDRRRPGRAGLSGATLGKEVYAARCGLCHLTGGYQDVTESLTGLSTDDYNDLLDTAQDYADAMPAFTGDAHERAALIAYLSTLKGGAP
ncbi:MAG: c-type cytochrome [Nitrospirota bacterium]|jgi:mono/diheme cytochrome c family protein